MSQVTKTVLVAGSHGVIGRYALGMVIAVYAAISKELGPPLRFPGPEAAYRALYQITSADILAKATDWAGSSPAARNEIFNITNGDYFRWQHMWPRIARKFDMRSPTQCRSRSPPTWPTKGRSGRK